MSVECGVLFCLESDLNEECRFCVVLMRPECNRSFNLSFTSLTDLMMSYA